jgi:hypothetical protein
MSNHVPSTTPVRRNRVANIDSDRLARRRQFLVNNIRQIARDADNRIDFVARVAELQAIEIALIQRGVLDRDDAHLTLRGRDGQSLV